MADSYVKHNWVSGEVVSSSLLNHIETGIESTNSYKVVANPTLEGTEANLTGLQVGETKYKVPTGGTGTADFDQLTNRPKYNGTEMTHETNIPEVKTSVWDGKQDNITDLEDIRTKANSAVQPATLNEYRKAADQDIIDASKQDKLPDAIADKYLHAKADGTGLEWIDAGGSSGEPAQYIKDASLSGNTLTLTKKDLSTVVYTPDLSGKQDVISDLETIRSGATAGATAVQPATLTADYRTKADQEVIDTTLQTNIDAKSTVSVSASGSATDEIQYITIDGTEKKIAGNATPTVSFTSSDVKTQLVSIDGKNYFTLILDDVKKAIFGNDSITTIKIDLSAIAGMPIPYIWIKKNVIQTLSSYTLVQYSFDNAGMDFAHALDTEHPYVKMIKIGNGGAIYSSDLSLLFVSFTNLSVDAIWDELHARYTKTETDNLLLNKQNVLPTTSTAGKVLKSTSTAGTVEWGDTGSNITVSSSGVSDGTNTYNASDKMSKANPTGTGSFGLNRIGTTGDYSFAEGFNCTASGDASHAEGICTIASGRGAHAEGSDDDGGITSTSTTASGEGSHAEGNGTLASGLGAHAEGYCTVANHKSQHVFGEYNKSDPSTEAATERGNYVEIVGNGTSDSSHSNARTLDWSGNEYLKGNLRAAGLTDGTTTKTMTEVLAGGTPTNMVTTDTEQTISGAKTFTNTNGLSITSQDTSKSVLIKSLNSLGSEVNIDNGKIKLNTDSDDCYFSMATDAVSINYSSATGPSFTMKSSGTNTFEINNMGDTTARKFIGGLEVLTTAPTEDNYNGYKLVHLASSTGVTEYNGYIYMYDEA